MTIPLNQSTVKPFIGLDPLEQQNLYGGALMGNNLIIPRSPKQRCIYCDALVGRVRKGEHIVPDAIGGVRTIKSVCGKCNNGVLSVLDTELCSASPVAIIASELLANGIGQTWDVDHRDGNMLLEGQPCWAEQSMTLWPQMVVTSAGPQIRGDWQEVASIGFDYFQNVFIRNARGAFARWRKTKKGLFFERMRAADDILNKYRYPPRIFARRRLHDFDDRMTFIVGYHTESDRKRLLNSLENWDAGRRFFGFESRIGSELPAVRRCWSASKILRALTKLGINLLYDTCTDTDVSRQSFAKAIAFVRGETDPTKDLARSSGFVWPSDLDAIHSEGDGHAFRLTHDASTWSLYSSFFGGRVCATVQFPGPSDESWKTADITTPLASADRDVSDEWHTKKRQLLLPIACHVEWNVPDRIVPSVPMLNAQTRIDTRNDSKAIY